MTPQEETIKKIATRIAESMDGRTVTSHGHYRDMLAKEIEFELSKVIEQVEKWAESRRMPVDKPDEDVSANALAEIFKTKLEAFDYSTNSFIDDLLAFLKELKK